MKGSEHESSYLARRYKAHVFKVESLSTSSGLLAEKPLNVITAYFISAWLISPNIRFEW